MEPSKVVTLLEGTINPTLRKDAEEQLESMCKIVGFAPLLLQIVMSEELQMAVRQAGAIYMKNTCLKSWHERDSGINQIFSIHENDKVTIRTNIVEAIIIAPDIIRSQLTMILSNIIKHDYPGKWPGVVDKISQHLQADNTKSWMGALLTLYQLTKNYEYTKVAEKQPLIAAMKLFVQPMLFLFKRFIEDNTSESVLIQKQILKILYALVQYSLPLELFSKEVLDDWMLLIKAVIERPVPAEVEQVDPLERPDLPWWKCKKWALHILARVFERYGSPGAVSKEYNQFADFFLKRYAVSVTQVLLKTLDNHRNGIYLSPRVLQQTLHFISQGVSHAHTWKVTKTVFEPVLKDIVFPLMCFTDEDQEVWEDDPHEYLRRKFDVFEDFLSPASAAQCLVLSACKRKQMLQKTMGLCYNVLTSSDIALNPRRKDGCLHIIGTLAETLLKRKIYKGQMEMMLASYVLPEYKSPHGYLRARACWVTQLFSEIKFNKVDNLYNIVDQLQVLLINDSELPVKVEAAIALQTMLCDQDKAEKHCEKNVRVLMMNLLQLVHETSNDDLTAVVQKMICLYCEQCVPIAVEITQNLASTFMKMLAEYEDGEAVHDETADDKSVAALGVLNTIETVLDMMEEEREITKQLEGIVTPLVAHVLKNRNMDFYEDTLSLLYSITCQAISPSMWEGLLLIYEVFDDDGFDYFTDMMPCLHNFVTIDTNAFLSNPKYLEVIYNMCKQVMEGDAGDDPESHAAKLLEVIVLQCKGRIDQVIPLIVEVALSRLTKEVKMMELRTMCLQVVVAALYYNPHLLLATLEQMHFPNTTESISDQFFSQWFNDIKSFLGIHDRRVCALGLCTLLNLPNRSPLIENLSPRIIPSLITLFQGLVKAYKNRGDGESSDDSESEDEQENGFEEEELSSSEDEIDEESAEYLEMLEKKAEDFAESFEEVVKDDGETLLEPYTSPLEADDDESHDEFIVFQVVLCSLEKRDPNFYAQIVNPLNADQKKALQDIYNLAEQRKAAAESKKIEKTGGYQFNLTHVPTSFQFGGGAPSSLSP